MLTLGSVASVVAAIREDAIAEVERIDQAAATELAAIRADAAGAPVVIAEREERLAAARRASEERIAKQEWEGRRAVLEQREAWIQRVVAAAHARWSGDASALVREAIAHLPKDAGPVTVNGLVVTAGDVSFDNSIEARARRLEPLWRKVLSEVYRP